MPQRKGRSLTRQVPISERRRKKSVGSPPSLHPPVSRRGSFTELVSLHSVGLLLIAAKVALVPVVLDPAGAEAFSLPKVAVSRALLYPMVLVLALYALRHRRELRWSPLIVIAFVYLFVAVAATVLAVHPFTALFGAPRRYLGLTSIVDNVVLFLAVATFVRTWRHAAVIGLGAAIGAAVVLLYGLVQLLHLDPLPWSDQTITSTIGNTGAFAGYVLAVGAAAGTVLLVSWGRLGTPLRLALVACLAFSAIETFATGTRGAGLAFPVAAVAVTLVAARAHAVPVRRISRRLAIGLSASVITFALITLFFTQTGARLLALARGGDASSAERSLIYQAALSAVAHWPILGVGPDGFTTVYLLVRDPATIQSTDVSAMQSSTHSWLLHQAVGTGLAGSIILLSVVMLAGFSGWRRIPQAGGPEAALGTVVMVVFVAQGIFSITHVASEWLFWVAVGLIAASESFVNGESAPVRRASRIREAPLAFGAVLIGILLAVNVTNSVAANRALRGSEFARAAGQFAIAEQLAQTAVERDGGRAEHWNALGLAREPRSREAAIAAYSRAVDSAPYESTYLMNLARQELRLSITSRAYLARAVEHGRVAVAKDPHNPLARVLLADGLILSGDAAGGAAEADRAVALRPTVASYLVAIDAYLTMSDAQSAVERLHAAASLAEQTRDPREFAIRVRLVETLAEASRVAEARSTLDEIARDSRLRASLQNRLRLVELYERLGHRAAGGALLAPPSVAAAGRDCTAVHGNGPTSDGAGTAPRCFRVSFSGEAPLQTDPHWVGAVVRPENYRVDDRELPPGTIVTYDEQQRIATVQLPADAPAPRSSAKVTMLSVADVFGRTISPDLVEIVLP